MLSPVHCPIKHRIEIFVCIEKWIGCGSLRWRRCLIFHFNRVRFYCGTELENISKKIIVWLTASSVKEERLFVREWRDTTPKTSFLHHFYLPVSCTACNCTGWKSHGLCATSLQVDQQLENPKGNRSNLFCFVRTLRHFLSTFTFFFRFKYRIKLNLQFKKLAILECDSYLHRPWVRIYLCSNFSFFTYRFLAESILKDIFPRGHESHRRRWEIPSGNPFSGYSLHHCCRLNRPALANLSVLSFVLLCVCQSLFCRLIGIVAQPIKEAVYTQELTKTSAGTFGRHGAGKSRRWLQKMKKQKSVRV